jgi:hypothetical protein
MNIVPTNTLLENKLTEFFTIHWGSPQMVTTDDNLLALKFYQKRGFELVRIHRNAVQRAREIKPKIPLIGNDGIPLKDEIELEQEFR